jgi:hypothetical protein
MAQRSNIEELVHKIGNKVNWDNLHIGDNDIETLK